MSIQFAEQRIILNTASERLGNIRSSEPERQGETTAITIELSIQDAGTTLTVGDLTVDGAIPASLTLPVTFAGLAFITKQFTITNVALAGKLLVATYHSTEYPYFEGDQVISFIGAAEDLDGLQAGITAANTALNVLSGKSDAIKTVVDGNATTGENIQTIVSDDASSG